MRPLRAFSGRRILSISAALAVALTLVVPTFAPMTANAGGRSGFRFTRLDACFLRKINQARRRHGLSGLTRDKQLGYVARRHSAQMAAYRSVWDQSDLGREVTRWRRLGQNSGSGGRCKHLFKSFVHSSPHAANIFGRYRFVGVGVERAGHRLYVTQIFESHRNPGNIYHTP